MSEYRGPSEIAWARFPGRGESYRADFAGYEVEVSVSEKAQKVRVFVDGKEWKP